MKPGDIKARREAYPLTQSSLARRAGVSVQAIRNWEHGRRGVSERYRTLLDAALTPTATIRYRRTRTGRHWCAAEDAELRRMVSAGAATNAIATALNRNFERHRTQSAVAHRAHDLGLSLRGDWYSEGDVCRLLGVHWKAVNRWRAGGALPATRSENVRDGAPSHWWRIEASDLAAFVERYAGVAFDPARVRNRTLKAKAEIAASANRRQAV